jgi:hypothetical protein
MLVLQEVGGSDGLDRLGSDRPIPPATAQVTIPALSGISRIFSRETFDRPCRSNLDLRRRNALVTRQIDGAEADARAVDEALFREHAPG